MTEPRARVPLAPLTTFKIGGDADFFISVASVPELEAALSFARGHALPVSILGGGSNVLVDDAGYRGLVIKIEIGGIEEEPSGDTTLLTAGAGVSWDALVARAVERGLWGIENLSGIPGTLGGAVVQDVGAYGAALSQTLQWVDVFDIAAGEVRRLSREECQFGYRDSIFKKRAGAYVVVRAALRLAHNPNPNLSYTDPTRAYKDLAERFADRMPTLAEVRTGILEIRRGKFPDLSVEGTAGSFFKNPVLSAAEAKSLQARYPGLPLFPLPESQGMKVPLGWLLDYRHGVIDMRAARAGGARLYEKHFLVIAAARGASAHDVESLARMVEEKVFAATGIRIEREVESFGAQKLSTHRG